MFGIRNDATGRVFFTSTNRGQTIRLATTSRTFTGTPVRAVFGEWHPIDG